MRYERYFNEGLLLTPGAVSGKYPIWNEWQKKSLSYRELLYSIGRNLNILLVLGEPTLRKDGRRLSALDFDEKPENWPEYLPTLRYLDTRINLSPRGMHVLGWIRKKEDWEPVQKILGTIKGLEPDKLHPVRGFAGAAYILVEPSRVNKHRYFYMDNGRQPIRDL